MELDAINIICFRCKVPLESIMDIENAEIGKGHGLTIICSECNTMWGNMEDDALTCQCVWHVKQRTKVCGGLGM
jgi:hypothetical protein